ncbi:CAZyme family GH18 [Penicillium roqueforti]|nr:CAZyme family GH18 [Penicillium roqueforti]
MTYDLHGQWDWNNTFVNPGCTNGNCLRSHVNLTETEYALSMITKAGVSPSKVVVGIASYGRSFGMEDPSCTDPECLFTGPNSTATEGDCTGTAGYISQAELAKLTTSGLTRRSVATWYDDTSDSDMMTYGDGTWVAYMKDSTKSSRINRYASYGFLGTVEWALDLTNFVLTAAEADATSNITAAEDAFTAALSLSGYNTSNFETYNLTLLASKLVGWHGCDPLQKKEIYSGWQQSWEIMNYMMSEAYDDKINWNEAATVEYLGAPAMNQHLRERFKNIYVNLATIQPGWIGMPWDWRIVARCDDPHLACSCGRDTQTVAYTVNSDQDEPSAPAINFCPPYFGQPTLKTVLESANPGFTPAIYADMNNYNGNQATTWMHELLHIDWVALANGWGPNTHVTDIKMKYNYDTGHGIRTVLE